jgi:excisionase family DNA binding protein
MNSAPITRQQAAELLGVSLRTISNHIRAGVLPPPHSLGGRRVYWRSDVFWAAVNDRLEPALVQKSSLSIARATENRRGPGRPRKSEQR